MRILRFVLVVLLVAAFTTLSFTQTIHQPKLTVQNSGTTGRIDRGQSGK